MRSMQLKWSLVYTKSRAGGIYPLTFFFTFNMLLIHLDSYGRSTNKFLFSMMLQDYRDTDL